VNGLGLIYDNGCAQNVMFVLEQHHKNSGIKCAITRKMLVDSEKQQRAFHPKRQGLLLVCT